MTTEKKTRPITNAELRKALDGCNPVNRRALLEGRVPIYAEKAGTTLLTLPEDLTSFELATRDAVRAKESPSERADASAIILDEIGRMSEHDTKGRVTDEIDRVFGSAVPTAKADGSTHPQNIDAVLEEAALLGGQPSAADLIAEASRLGGTGAV